MTSNMNSILPELSFGFLTQMTNNNNDNNANNPKKLQILGFESRFGPHYYWAVVNDGITEHNKCLINSSKYSPKNFDNNCLVEVNNYSVETFPETDINVLLIEDLRVLVAGSVVGRKIEFEDTIIEETFDDELNNDSDETQETQGSISQLLNEFESNSSENVSEEPSNSLNPNNNAVPFRLDLSSPDLKRPRVVKKPLKFDDKPTPIKDLLTGNRRQILKGKVISVYPLAQWSSGPLTGVRLDFNFSDGIHTIRCKAWNEMGSQLKYTLKAGHFYNISGVTVKSSTYAPTLGQKEVHLNDGAIVTPYKPKFHYKDFVKLNELDKYIGKKVDVIGIIRDYHFTKNEKRKDFKLKDKLNFRISVTLQNKTAQHFGANNNDLLVIKNAIVLNKYCIKSGANTHCIVDPDCEAARLLLESHNV